jgi:ectoine hydroxylase
MLNNQQLETYQEQGFLVLENQVPKNILSQIDTEIAQFYDRAATLSESDDVIDLETTHSPSETRIRRIKFPHLNLPSCADLMRQHCILDPVRDLIGPNLRLHTSKLNFKSAGYGAAVEWHQDWAFYPHTNDDILAVGVLLDDMTLDNGALLMLPGTQHGPIYDHHVNGEFVGAIRPDRLILDAAVPVIAPAGSISLHHVRMVHGSDMNRSNHDRRLLLLEITAADAFPVMGSLSKMPSIEEYNARLLCGEATLEPRLTNVPVRIPLPAPKNFSSIYEVQSNLDQPAFESLPKKD